VDVLNRLVYELGLRIEAEGLPAVRITAGNQEWTLGQGEPAVTVTLGPGDDLRAALPEPYRSFLVQ
jgi:hypothetical protein